MRKLSFWAHRHPWGARFAIVGSFVLLNLIGILVGLLLKNMNVFLPLSFLLAGAGLYAASFLAYPQKLRKGLRYYWRRKVFDLGLAASTFLMVIYMGNQPGQLFRYSSPFQTAMASVPYNPGDNLRQKGHKSIRDFSASMKGEDGKMLKWKERKKLLKEQIRGIKKSNEFSKKQQIGLIILSVIIAIGLLMLVAALACSIACNGSGVLAVIVGVGGAAVIIILLLSVIRKLSRKHKEETRKTISEPSGG